jgi:hypothetical protein
MGSVDSKGSQVFFVKELWLFFVHVPIINKSKQEVQVSWNF